MKYCTHRLSFWGMFLTGTVAYMLVVFSIPNILLVSVQLLISVCFFLLFKLVKRPIQVEESVEEVSRYCKICKVNVDVDARHCFSCNICVTGLQSHYKLIGCCVGNSNFSHFMLLLFVTLARAVLSLLMSVFFIFDEESHGNLLYFVWVCILIIIVIESVFGIKSAQLIVSHAIIKCRGSMHKQIAPLFIDNWTQPIIKKQSLFSIEEASESASSSSESKIPVFIERHASLTI